MLQVLSIILQESDHSRDVRGEIANIRTEMSKISMMDEFARHARLQRKLIKLQDELKSESRPLFALYTSALSSFTDFNLYLFL